MAQALVDRETLDKDAVAALLNGHWDEYLANEAAHAEDKKPEDVTGVKPRRRKSASGEEPPAAATPEPELQA